MWGKNNQLCTFSSQDSANLQGLLQKGETVSLKNKTLSKITTTASANIIKHRDGSNSMNYKQAITNFLCGL